MRIDAITIFPGYLAPLREALLGKAIARGLIELYVHDLRDYTHDVHRAVDDAPYGGGPGMVMKPQVWGEALDAVCGPEDRPSPVQEGQPSPAPEDQALLAPEGRPSLAPGTQPLPARRPVLIVPTPAGRPFTQAIANEY